MTASQKIFYTVVDITGTVRTFPGTHNPAEGGRCQFAFVRLLPVDNTRNMDGEAISYRYSTQYMKSLIETIPE